MKVQKIIRASAIFTILAVAILATTRLRARTDLSEPLSAVPLYRLGGGWPAIKATKGKTVLIDVIVLHEREVPLVEIFLPKKYKADKTIFGQPVHAHLQNGGTAVKQLKKGQQVKISGVVVNGGFGAYVIDVKRILKIYETAETPETPSQWFGSSTPRTKHR